MTEKQKESEGETERNEDWLRETKPKGGGSRWCSAHGAALRRYFWCKTHGFVLQWRHNFTMASI